MSTFNEIASLWMEGTMHTLDAFRTGFGAPAQRDDWASNLASVSEA